jgi:hypothetical protein
MSNELQENLNAGAHERLETVDTLILSANPTGTDGRSAGPARHMRLRSNRRL